MTISLSVRFILWRNKPIVIPGVHPNEVSLDVSLEWSLRETITKRRVNVYYLRQSRMASPDERCGPMQRREFLCNGLASACTLALAPRSAPKAIFSADSRIEILIGESLGTISDDT